LREEIKRITGMEVREAATEIEPASGAVVQAFTTGTVVQVFLLAGRAPTETWSNRSGYHAIRLIKVRPPSISSQQPTHRAQG